ncbi:MAG: bacillithiol biosynthesis cysteine-adding enzyme BshC [Acidobacteriota bacterium]|nr:bacillithiol biosynthesis cysteine-adding enzyme BshC [Acidobacteriota bacterium]
MSTECYPISTLFPTTRLYRDYLAMGDAPPDAPVRSWYGSDPLGGAWMRDATAAPAQDPEHRTALAAALERQNVRFGAGAETLQNIAKLAAGARAVVTGQQVGLLGGPLLTLLKAATAVARARQVSAASGVEHVPVFWLATEDHDLAEIDQVSLLTRNGVETLRLGQAKAQASSPVGDLKLGEAIGPLLDSVCELLGHAPVCDLLRECYDAAGAAGACGSAPTYACAFARLMSRLFARHGLIVLDAAGRDFHALGRATLRAAIERAGELEPALLARTAELETGGYHAQVLVKPGSSLLFLLSEPDAATGAVLRQPLRRLPDESWRAGAGASARTYTTSDLLDILYRAPERLSPNALLRPVFQDTLLPTTAYVGGPAEIAYLAQSSVLYQKILGRTTPVIPRFSATLIEPAIGAAMDRHEVSFADALNTAEVLAQRLGARAMPIEGKRRLADAGNALDTALGAAHSYLASLDAGLGRSAEVSASKMRYQMNRLRRLAANFELQRQESLSKDARAITQHLFPDGHPQERLLGGAWFLAAWESAHGTAPGDAGRAGLIDLLVAEAGNQCPGHVVVRL